MDNKNSIIGVILISILVMMLMYNNAVKRQLEEEKKQVQTEESTTEKVTEENDSLSITENAYETKDTSNNEVDVDTSKVQQATISNKFGYFSVNNQVAESDVVLENDLLKVVISNKGAQVKQVELKEFLTHNKTPLFLIDETQDLDFVVEQNDGKKINLSDLYFEHTKTGNNKISLKVKVGDDGYIKKVYSLNEGSYLLDYDIKFHNTNKYLADKNIDINWRFAALPQEQNLEREKQKSTIFWRDLNEGVEHLSTGASKNKTIEEPVEWVAFKQQFFSNVLMSNGDFVNTQLRSQIDMEDTSLVAIYTANLQLPFSVSDNIQEYELKYFFGPNNYKMLKKMGYGMQDVVELSYDFFLFNWVKYISKWVIIPIFNTVEKVVSSYGIVILIMTLVIKLMLMPLTFKSYVSMAKTKLLRPELEELKKKFKDDQQGYAAAQMELYQKTGVSMFGGCLPMLLQMPFLLAMFYFFPSSIELRQEGFLWAQDLSTYDNVLNLPFTIPIYGSHVSAFTLLMAISSILYAKYNSQMQAQPSQPGMEMMKYMPYFFPIFLMFLFNSWPAALTYYYFLSNVITMSQQFVINKFFIDEDKLMQQIEENKLKKPKKKSKFASKLEDMYKQQQNLNEKKKKK